MSMKPKHFKRGDPFSARHMNDIIGEARGARSVRASNDGFVNDPQGNRVFNTAPPAIRLVVAIEDFEVQNQPTDFMGVVDKAPSGKCLMLRLNGQADYIEETRSKPFRVYDPIAYRNSTDSQSAGNSFHVAWNSDTKRWEVLGIAGSSGGGHEIWFVIEDMLCPNVDYVDDEMLVVTPEIYTGGCNKVPPGGNYDGTYDVYNYCGEFVGLTETDLIGTRGKATYGYPLTGYCEPKWYVDFLCAQPEC
jgi:hypothetical protein